jgi:serine protease Do
MSAKTNPQETSRIANLNQPVNMAGVSDARNTAIVRAAQAVAPAVVGITNNSYSRDYFNRKVVQKEEGSGVIIDSNGYIATNNHVVDGAQELVVALPDGRTFTSKVLGVDPATDLAVVKIDATGLPAATLGDSNGLLVGEPAIAIGNPLGLEFQGSVTVGILFNPSIEQTIV